MRRLPSCVPLPGQLIGPLEAYCGEQFGWLQCSEIAHTFAELQRLRDSVVAVLTPRSASEEAVTRLTEYGGLLRAVSSRLSGSPCGPPANSVLRLQLPWLCSFFYPSSTSSTSSNNGSSSLWGGRGASQAGVRSVCTLEEEICCCICALGALQHNKAVLLQRSEGGQYKEAVRCFSQAASLFRLAEALSPPGQPLHSDAKASAAFSLAHAQSVCYEVASRESMSLSFRSKLAAHASTLFAAAAEGLQEVQQKLPAESSLIPTLQRSSKATEAVALEGWCRSQELCFLAIAHLQLALEQKHFAETEGEGFGLLVARTMLAEEFVSKAEAAAGAAAARTPEAPRLQTSKLRAAVDALLTTAKRDNQLVYMEPVPPVSSLPALEESSGLRGTVQVSLQQVLPPNRRVEQQLSALLPAGVRALADEYEALFQSTTAQVNTETNCLLSQVAAFLQKEQLPSALRSRLADRQQQPQGYGACKERQEQIHPASSNGTASFDFHFEFSTACSHELLSVQSLGGAQRLRQQQKMLEHLSADAAGQLNTVQHQLQSQLELLLQQREQQQQQHPDASGECTSQQRQQQKLLALEGNTQELIECARMYTSKLLQAQQANELIGTKTLRALGPLQLPCSVYTSTGGANTAAAATSEALSVATPTLEQLLCLPKEGAEGLLQKLLLQLQLREEDSKQQHLLQRHLDAAHSALVELEAQIYILQEEQHKLCQSEDLLPEHILQQLRQAAAATCNPTASVCTAAASASLRDSAKRTRDTMKGVARQLETAQQRWRELLAAESAKEQLEQQQHQQRAAELQQVVQHQASSLRKSFDEQQQGLAFYSRLQGFLQQLQQHQQQVLTDIHECIRSLHQQQQEEQQVLHKMEPQHQHSYQLSPCHVPSWPTVRSLNTRSGHSSAGSTSNSYASNPPTGAHWRRCSSGPLVLPGSKPRRLSCSTHSRQKQHQHAAASPLGRQPSFPSPDSNNSRSGSRARVTAGVENNSSLSGTTGASFALAHSPLRPRSSRNSTPPTGSSPVAGAAADPCSGRPVDPPLDIGTVFGATESPGGCTPSAAAVEPEARSN